MQFRYAQLARGFCCFCLMHYAPLCCRALTRRPLSLFSVCSAPRSPTLPSDLPFSATPIFSLQQQAALGTLPQRPPSLPLAPPGFVPVAEPQSPLAGLHWADGFPPVPAPQPAAVSTGAAGGGFLGVGVGGSAALPPLDAPFASPFKLEDQDGAALWDAEEAQAGQPWYFGTGGDLSTLSLPTAVSLMDCSSGAGDDDEVPLLTLDLGGEGWSGVGRWPGGPARGRNASARVRQASGKGSQLLPQCQLPDTRLPLSLPPSSAAAIDVSI